MEAIPTHFRDFKFVNKFLSGEKVIWLQDIQSIGTRNEHTP